MDQAETLPQLRTAPLGFEPTPSAQLESWIVHGRATSEDIALDIYMALWLLRDPKGTAPAGALMMTRVLNERTGKVTSQMRVTAPALDRLDDAATQTFGARLPMLRRIARKRYRRSAFDLIRRIEGASLDDKGPRFSIDPFVISWAGMLVGHDPARGTFRLTIPLEDGSGLEGGVDLPEVMLDEGADRLWPGSRAGSYEQVAPALPLNGQVGRAPVTGRAWIERRRGDPAGWFLSGTGRASRLAGWRRMSIYLSPQWQILLHERHDAVTDETLAQGVVLFENGRPIAVDGGFNARPVRHWDSPLTGARYAVDWAIEIPGLDMTGQFSAKADDQEIPVPGGLSMWQGAGTFEGRLSGEAITGHARCELLGPGAANSVGERLRRRIVWGV